MIPDRGPLAASVPIWVFALTCMCRRCAELLLLWNVVVRAYWRQECAGKMQTIQSAHLPRARFVHFAGQCTAEDEVIQALMDRRRLQILWSHFRLGRPYRFMSLLGYLGLAPAPPEHSGP